MNMKKVEKIISAGQCKFAARIFNIGSIIAVLSVVLVPIWIAGSIFTYASIAHHPDSRVGEYNRWAGYRFYGLVGSLVVVLNFTGEMKELLGGTFAMWLTVYVVSVLVVVPLGLWDIYRAGQESWRDMTVELEVHE
jgi:hypothetical protein